jgi:hypothetical protein
MMTAGEIAPLAIIMPSDGLERDGSAYLTHPGSENVERWIVEETPAMARIAVLALRADAKVLIGGLSMGGMEHYGLARSMPIGSPEFPRIQPSLK